MKHTQETKEMISRNNAKYWLGKKRPTLSIEHKEKLISSLKGNNHTKGMKFPDRKKPSSKSEETRKKHSMYKGDKAMNWKGGGWAYQKQQTLKRDDWTCQMCGVRDIDVAEIDHKIPRKLRPDLRNDPNNLWVLCANDHRRKTKKDFELILKVREVERMSKK